ncbi:MAG: methylmalonyl Co-A mutase-associated GTPase MeaB [Flavobacteriales bacterium]
MGDTSRNKAEQDAITRIRDKRIDTPAEDLIAGVLEGNRVALGQAITCIESTNRAHRELASQILKACLLYSGNSLRIGITGVPGVGKSTFIDTFGEFLIGENKKVAVLAIDPSSASTGGSILGDKTRMERLSMNENAFIRPSPSSSTLGGVARKTRESIVLCEAAGYDVILVETVGVGQSETAVHGMTDFFLLLMLAGAGDQLQGIKRGIMEMADGMVITKADGSNENLAGRAQSDYQSALHLFPPRSSSWTPRVLTTSALENKGIGETWNMILAFEAWMKERSLFHKNRQSQDENWMMETLHQLLNEEFFANESNRQHVIAARLKMAAREITPFEAADWIISNRK